MSVQSQQPDTSTAALQRAGRTARRSGWFSFRERNLIIGGTFILALITIAVAAPILAPFGPLETDYSARLLAPGGDHWFGTDNFGRDILSRIIWGARIDLPVGIGAVIAPFVIGIVLGSLAGYYGGVIDSMVMRLADVIQAFPFLILIIAVIAVLGTGLRNVFIAVAIVAWVSYARLIRSEILVARQKEFVEAARAMGASDKRVIIGHILPNVLTSAVVFAMSDVILYIVLVASLSFLGLGAQPPSPEWGAMIMDGRTFIESAWWISFFPGMAIVVTGIAFSIFGDGLADAMRIKRR